jgi:hypothetical protein
MNRTASIFLALALTSAASFTTIARAEAPKDPAATAAPKTGAKEVTLKGMLGCGKCSFQEAKACQNVLKVKDGNKVVSYDLADNEVARANHEKVCGPASPATVTGIVEKGTKKGRKLLTATAITFES